MAETQQGVNVPLKTVYVNGRAADRMALQAQEDAARQAALYNQLMPHYQQQLDSSLGAAQQQLDSSTSAAKKQLESSKNAAKKQRENSKSAAKKQKENSLAAAKNQRSANKDTIRKQFKKQMASLLKRYKQTLQSQKNDYTRNKSQVNTQTNEKLREAWVSMMLSTRNMEQKLSARGLTGGVAETVALAADNAHARSRAKLEQSRSDSLGDLLYGLQQSQAKTKSDYQSAKTDKQTEKSKSIAKVKETYQKQAGQAKNTHQKQLNQARSTHQKQLNQAKNTYQKQIDQAKKSFTKNQASALAKLYK